MVHKYELFEILYSKKSPLTAPTLLGYLKRKESELKNIQKTLERMVIEDLIVKTDHGFQVKMNQKNQLLYLLIRFCLDNKLNYRKLLRKSVAKFISIGLKRRQFSGKDHSVDAKTFSKYINLLSRSGLCIILSQRPLVATIPHNSFLRDYLIYFDHKVLVAKLKNDEYIEEIARELKVFEKLRETHEQEYQEIVRKYKIQFIRHSLHLEGNPITLSDTIILLREQVVPRNLQLEHIQEVQNYQMALEAMITEVNEGRRLTQTSILNYHFLAMNHHPEFAGKIRDVEVYIRGNEDFSVAKVQEIQEQLDQLLIEYAIFVRKKNTVLKEILFFAGYLHNQFQHIHPFVDGNSRVTRLLTFHLLLSFEIPIFDIPLGLLEEYLHATKGAKRRDDKRLSQVLQRIILYNVKTINIRLRESN